MRIVDFSASAEPVIEVAIIGVALGGRLRMDRTLDSSSRIDSQDAWRGRGETCGSAIAREVSSAEQFDQSMLAVTLDRARIAYSGGIISARI